MVYHVSRISNSINNKFCFVFMSADRQIDNFLSLLDQDIITDRRIVSYVNPFFRHFSQWKREHKKKAPKKLHRGARLNTHNDL